jgi:zinc protease
MSKIEYARHILQNGLRVVVHPDRSTPMVAVNVVYNVGSRNEDRDKTGFAHLFEHLMFGGSAHIPDFDEPIQDAGGENNAFTNADLTNFYEVLPAQNIETALWLESDRMKSLNFSKKSLKTQQKVVIEEYKETCLNEPYGDMWHHMSALAYKQHPYHWPTIGLDIKHISDATLEDVKSFFYRYYRPNNAALVISGDISVERGIALAERWFADIEAGPAIDRSLPEEPQQQDRRSVTIKSHIPSTAFFHGYKMCGRMDKDYYATDLLSDLLANGRSSRFYQKLYKEAALFSTIDAFISGTHDPGLFLIEGKLLDHADLSHAQSVLRDQLDLACSTCITDKELEKLKNQVESSIAYSDASLLNKTLSLAYFEMLGDAGMINEEAEKYMDLTAEDIRRVAEQTFDERKLTEVIYVK